MLESILLGISGLQTYSAGLKVISNNIANLNTPGFKSSDMQFESLYQQSSSSQFKTEGDSKQGSGVIAGETFVNFKAGNTQQTGNPLDLSVSGEGFFVTQSPDSGQVTYTRNGQFEFDKNGTLVLRGTDQEVKGMDSSGAQQTISLNGLRISAPQPTTKVVLTGNISSTASSANLDSISVIDRLGSSHTLKMVFTPKTDATGTWTATLTDGTTQVGSQDISFVGGRLTAGADSFTISYTPSGGSAMDLKFDLSQDVTTFETGQTSSIAVTSTDGRAMGSLNSVSFDSSGYLQLKYTNNDSAKGPQIALAMFDHPAELQAVSNNSFSYGTHGGITVGTPGSGSFGTLQSSQIEGSNVDLATEFSDLIVTQRGYQASSRVVTTASEMLQDLLDMKGHR